MRSSLSRSTYVGTQRLHERGLRNIAFDWVRKLFLGDINHTPLEIWVAHGPKGELAIPRLNDMD
jgi:hypothetical protein